MWEWSINLVSSFSSWSVMSLFLCFITWLLMKYQVIESESQGDFLGFTWSNFAMWIYFLIFHITLLFYVCNNILFFIYIHICHNGCCALPRQTRKCLHPAYDITLSAVGLQEKEKNKKNKKNKTKCCIHYSSNTKTNKLTNTAWF